MGLPIVGVLPGSFAESAGIQVGDELIEIDGREIHNINDFLDSIKDRNLRLKPTQVVKVIRSGQELTIEMALGKYEAGRQPN